MRNNKIVVLQGPPCSGKTHWSNEDALKMEFDKGPEIIRTKDLSWKLREDGKYDIELLDALTPEEFARIRKAIKVDEITVFIDAVNLNERRISIINNPARELDCEVVIKQFYCSYNEAIERNKKRRYNKEEYVPREVITTLYKQYYPVQFQYEMTDHRIIKEPDWSKPDCIICDLDMTLALHQGRGPLDWDEIPTDKIEPRLRYMLNTYMEKLGVKVFFITGRTNSAAKATMEWLNKPEHALYSNWVLITRPNHCFIPGEEYKKNMYEEFIKDKYNVVCVFEDSNKCVEMWRSLGLLTCQVAVSD